ncbi:hypothetical protein BABINDRAFT_66069 [Babjeviella inositovora NRRL Y-12698]|uniref:SnoRNA-binding rRNA-processing protein n=1 Tax=Babjeviella inositovora NRRL Y-12698 TaxID=984486 RepID=A0A1E3QK62_9ASCO|nr:uncharacterized protein BABINDRAFT_66069 [Babjeviella inositovora NRRL Y-12698]ODQ78040.1 hypothetical protein BABINDRAFT_66069 [Babjeviella inositovora NRRL Y-12698]
MGKISVSDGKNKPHQDSLYKELTTDRGHLRTKTSKKKAKLNRKDDDELNQGFIDATQSRKILQLAKEQQEEVEEEENDTSVQPKPAFGASFLEREESSDEEDYENISDFGGSDDEYEVDEEEVEIDEKDAAMFDSYFQNNQQFDGLGGAYNLADKIMAKIQAKEAGASAPAPMERPTDRVLLPPKVIRAYETVGQILASWTHGKLPKLFKVIPSLNNWQDVLFVTNPDKWTPHVCYEATKLFVSNLQAREAEKFIETVLLERFRTDIEESETHSLNYHLYRAVKKSLYKPGAFFKGFLFPLVEGGCSVREATIAGSVLAKVSIPALHSSVALSYLIKQEFSPAGTVFIRILLEKKYALPYQTVDDVVFYFMNFRKAAQNNTYDEMIMEEEVDAKTMPSLPVVWHKAFLAFAQRYKNDITDDQRDFLLETVRQRFHRDIGPEIRRELLAGKPRLSGGEKEPEMVDAY